jgi:hypothetical protein
MGEKEIFAQVPRSISYQGVLIRNKVPVTAIVNMDVRIYNAAGELLYNESYDKLQVSNGIFNVLLGGNAGTLPVTMKFDEQYYIGIDVDNTGEMMPRTPFVSAPYAINSQTVGGIGVSVTPQAGMLIPLDQTGKLPKSVFPVSGQYVSSVNGIEGDNSGNIKFVSGDPTTLRVTDDAPNHRVIITAIPATEQSLVTANSLTGSGVNKYSGSIPIPQNALTMKIDYTGIMSISNVLVTISDPSGQTIQSTVSQVTPGVGFTVVFSGYYPTKTGKLNYLVIN